MVVPCLIYSVEKVYAMAGKSKGRKAQRRERGGAEDRREKPRIVLDLPVVQNGAWNEVVYENQ